MNQVVEKLCPIRKRLRLSFSGVPTAHVFNVTDIAVAVYSAILGSEASANIIPARIHVHCCSSSPRRATVSSCPWFNYRAQRHQCTPDLRAYTSLCVHLGGGGRSSHTPLLAT